MKDNKIGRVVDGEVPEMIPTLSLWISLNILMNTFLLANM